MEGRTWATFQALSIWQVATRVGKQKHFPGVRFIHPLQSPRITLSGTHLMRDSAWLRAGMHSVYVSTKTAYGSPGRIF